MSLATGYTRDHDINKHFFRPTSNLRNRCRQKGIQAGTIDALLAQLCVHYDLTMLTTDNDFKHIASVVPLNVWSPA